MQSSETRRQRKGEVEWGRYWLARRMSTAIASTYSKTMALFVTCGWSRPSAESPFDHVALLLQRVAHAVAEFALHFDATLDDGPARAARAFQFAAQPLQKRLVLRQAVDDGHCLPAATLLLHAQLRDHTRRNRFAGGAPAAALAVALRPPAAGTGAAGVRGVDDARVALEIHRPIIGDSPDSGKTSQAP